MYGDNVEENENDDRWECPHCGKSESAMIMRDYTGYHNRETMLHCNECDGLFIVVYKLDHVVKLERKVVK